MVDNFTDQIPTTDTTEETTDVSVFEPDVQDDIRSIKEVQEDTIESVNNEFHMYRSTDTPTDIEITCKVVFNVYNGQRIPDKNDLVKFWEGNLEPDAKIIDGVDSTKIKGFKIIDLISATEISTGYHLEGIKVVARAVPIIEK